MKALVTIAGICFFVVVFCLVAARHLKDSAEDDEHSWEQFSIQHHCRLKQASFWTGNVWTCEGFDIHHQ